MTIQAMNFLTAITALAVALGVAIIVAIILALREEKCCAGCGKPRDGEKVVAWVSASKRSPPLPIFKKREVTTNTNICFEDWRADQMKDPELRAAREELEPEYQAARLRIMRSLTQEQLAEL